MKPTRYYVEIVTRWVEDEPPETKKLDFESLAMAAAACLVHVDQLPMCWERRNRRDVTPKGDPRGLLWDWDDYLVWDAPGVDEVEAALEVLRT